MVNLLYIRLFGLKSCMNNDYDPVGVSVIYVYGILTDDYVFISFNLNR